MCVCERERERERESVCVRVCEREREDPVAEHSLAAACLLVQDVVHALLIYSGLWIR